MRKRSAPYFLISLICLAVAFPISARADLGAHVGAHLGFGTMGGGNQVVGNTSVGALDVHLMPGYRVINNFMPGILANLRFISQLAGEDVGGTGSLFGLALAYVSNPYKAIFSWDMRARHSQSTPETTYKGSGFTLLFGYQTMQDLFVDFQFNRTTYNAREVLNVEQTLTNPVVHWNLAIGVSYNFF